MTTKVATNAMATDIATVSAIAGKIEALALSLETTTNQIKESARWCYKETQKKKKTILVIASFIKDSYCFWVFPLHFVLFISFLDKRHGKLNFLVAFEKSILKNTLEERPNM